MNWTGGTKNRFRSRGEINCQKASFHQQRRLVLAESLEPKEEVKELSVISLPQTHQNLPCTPDKDLFDDGSDERDQPRDFPLTPFAFINEDSRSSASMLEKTQEDKIIEKELSIHQANASFELTKNSSANYSPTNNPSFSIKGSNSPFFAPPKLPQQYSSLNNVKYNKKPLQKRKFVSKFPICQHTCKCRIIRVVRKIKVQDSSTQTED